jgi:hypothetical protein
LKKKSSSGLFYKPFKSRSCLQNSHHVCTVPSSLTWRTWPFCPTISMDSGRRGLVKVNWSLLYRSCQTALTQVTKSTLFCSTSQRHSTKYQNKRLLHKWNHYWIRGNSLQWIASFLQ